MAASLRPPDDAVMARERVAGLVLAGGYSRRMGRDKAGMIYHGRDQLHHAFDLLRSLTEACYVAIREDQLAESHRSTLPCLIDAADAAGPAAGLLAAQQRYPDTSWLLLACDMPLINRSMLQTLLSTAKSDPQTEVIAYAAADGRIEPMCSLWRPASKVCLQREAMTSRNGLRHIAEQLRIRLLQPSEPGLLVNANTPDESAAILSQLQ